MRLFETLKKQISSVATMDCEWHLKVHIGKSWSSLIQTLKVVIATIEDKDELFVKQSPDFPNDPFRTTLFYILLELNPYAPPEANLAHETEAERIRKAHLATESNIRSTGGIYLFVAVLAGIAGLIRILTLEPDKPMDWGIAALQFILGTAFAWTGYWVRHFKASSRMPATALSVLSLALFPLGTIVGLHMLYNIHSKRGKMIFTPEYQDILGATPHIIRRSSFSCLRILFILIIFFLIVFTFLMLGPLRYLWLD